MASGWPACGLSWPLRHRWAIGLPSTTRSGDASPAMASSTASTGVRVDPGAQMTRRRSKPRQPSRSRPHSSQCLCHPGNSATSPGQPLPLPAQILAASSALRRGGAEFHRLRLEDRPGAAGARAAAWVVAGQATVGCRLPTPPSGASRCRPPTMSSRGLGAPPAARAGLKGFVDWICLRRKASVLVPAVI